MKTFRQVHTCPWTWFPWQLITVVSPTFRLRATSHLFHPNSIFPCLSCLNISSSPPDSCLDQQLLNIPLQKLPWTQLREDAKWIFITGRNEQATQCFLVARSVAYILLIGHWESSKTWALMPVLMSLFPCLLELPADDQMLLCLPHWALFFACLLL